MYFVLQCVCILCCNAYVFGVAMYCMFVIPLYLDGNENLLKCNLFDANIVKRGIQIEMHYFVHFTINKKLACFFIFNDTHTHTHIYTLYIYIFSLLTKNMAFAML